MSRRKEEKKRNELREKMKGRRKEEWKEVNTGKQGQKDGSKKIEGMKERKKQGWIGRMKDELKEVKKERRKDRWREEEQRKERREKMEKRGRTNGRKKREKDEMEEKT